ncbi:unnamed protein product [Musa acuminata subsp. malaccensis]|uniref:(wild Malaysian banana) hypothetical protein n=1 Tax=Musa acuminata subsp. malaccensis TaxID=214687 RepID=A0A804JYW6_MUSAM|nr:unnamed protein product [Musa acuminata subsp. malaccensis]
MNSCFCLVLVIRRGSFPLAAYITARYMYYLVKVTVSPCESFNIVPALTVFSFFSHAALTCATAHSKWEKSESFPEEPLIDPLEISTKLQLDHMLMFLLKDSFLEHSHYHFNSHVKGGGRRDATNVNHHIFLWILWCKMTNVWTKFSGIYIQKNIDIFFPYHCFHLPLVMSSTPFTVLIQYIFL